MLGVDHVQIEPVGPRDCGGTSDASGFFMDYHHFCKLADGLPEMAELHLQGRGEPLLHLHLFDMVRYAVQRGILVSLSTGLSVLTEQRAEECVASGLFRIELVADAAALRQASTGAMHPRFFRILRNLRRLIRARSRLRSLRPEVSLRALVDHHDLPELPGLIRFAHDEGIEKMAIEIADPDSATAVRMNPPFRLAARDLFVRSETLARSIGVTLEPLRFLRDGPRHSPGQRPSFIGYNGELVHLDPTAVQEGIARMERTAAQVLRPPVAAALDAARAG